MQKIYEERAHALNKLNKLNTIGTSCPEYTTYKARYLALDFCCSVLNEEGEIFGEVGVLHLLRGAGYLGAAAYVDSLIIHVRTEVKRARTKADDAA